MWPAAGSPVILVLMSLLVLVQESLQSLPSCDFTLYPSSGCPEQVMTSCQVASNRCVCRTGYPIEVNGRCFEYKAVGMECITSSQCFKGKCVDTRSGQELVLSEQGVEAAGKGTCECTEDRFLHPVRQECTQRLIHKKCTFFSNTADCGPYAYCDRGRCSCRPGFVYDVGTDVCITNPIHFSPPCFSAGSIVVTENGTTRCRHRGGDLDGYYPHFRRPSYANLMWPVFAFFLVLLMFKLLKEGIERECPNPGPGTTVSTSFLDTRRPTSRFNVMLPIARVPGPSHNGASRNNSANSGHTQQLSQARAPHSVRSPSLDTIISLPPPYDSQTMTPPRTTTRDLPPSYEEATRKE